MTLKWFFLYMMIISASFTSSFSIAKATAEIERKLIESTKIEGTDEELNLMLVTFPPGAKSPPHMHPVVGLNYILEGTAESQYEGDVLKTCVAGQSYQDPANQKHLIFRNKSQKKLLKFLITFKIKKGEPFKVDLSSKDSKKIHFGVSHPDFIKVSKVALFPEGIAYNSKSGKFLLSSFREGAVYEVGTDGTATLFVNDPRLNSVLGLCVDTKRNRLLVANSDIGSAVRPYANGPRMLASVGIYDLTSGKALHFIDLGKLATGSNHLANDLTIDTQGNAYVTDSLSPVIYKIDVDGNASVFLESDSFRAEGIGLNGIIFHPEGFLIVTKKDNGALFKVPLDNPKSFSKISVPESLQGSDGLVLAGNSSLVVICNKTPKSISNTVFSLETIDNWKTASVVDRLNVGDVYPTTGVLKDDKLYIVNSNLNELIAASKSDQRKLNNKAKIQQVGTVGEVGGSDK